MEQITVSAVRSACKYSQCSSQPPAPCRLMPVKGGCGHDGCMGGRCVGLIDFAPIVTGTVGKIVSAVLTLTLTGTRTDGLIEVVSHRSDGHGRSVCIDLATADGNGRVFADVAAVIADKDYDGRLIIRGGVCVEAVVCGVGTTAPPIINAEISGGGGGGGGGGGCCLSTAEAGFWEGEIELSGAEGVTPVINVSDAEKLTFFVLNRGMASVTVAIQLSPDGIRYVGDSEPVVLEAGEMALYVPYRFAKFMRVRVLPVQPDSTVDAKVWYQAQSRNYRLKE